MKNFLKNHGLWILFAAAVLSVGLAFLTYYSTTTPLESVFGTILSPFRSAAMATTNWIKDKQNYYADNKAMQEEIQALKNQIAEMEEDVRNAREAEEENERLRQLLNLQEQKREIQYRSAWITEYSTTNWSSSLTLNQGTSSGIEIGDCVVTEEHYLVGIVSEAGSNWCTVLTLLDTDTSLGAKIFRTEELCVASGDFSLMTEGLLRLDYLPSEDSLLNGDLIVTSGKGGFYPSDIVIGSIAEVKKDDSGAVSYAVLTPSADLSRLTEVFVIIDFEIVE